MEASITRGALIAVPLALIAVAVVQRRRNGSQTSVKLPTSGGKMQERLGGATALRQGGARLQSLGGATALRLGGARAQKLAGGKPQGKRHKPNNRMRYYGLALLINALERDRTRKAVIAGLKLAQKRA
jgi:hypothetical protein